MDREKFIADVANHEIQIRRDDGLYRHIRFSRPGTSVMGFELVTWPCYLSYGGDMGDYVFTRISDMFQFFRTRHGGSIARHYWAEKCRAADKNDGIYEFSHELFRSNLRDHFDQFFDDDNADKPTLWNELSQSIDRLDENDERAHYEWAMSYQYDNHYPFEGFWESNCQEFTYRFSWCCQAIAWGISLYDATKGAPGE